MNNLTDFGGGSVLPSLAATKKSLSPWRLSKGFFVKIQSSHILHNFHLSLAF
nr:MAG TPA: hypothetical protein [Caudoviricetes sp.]